jgi:transposase
VLSTRVLPLDHHCPWREEAEELRVELHALQERQRTDAEDMLAITAQMRADAAQMRAEIDSLKRHVFGKRSEKMPPMSREAARAPSPQETREKRAARAAMKAKLVTEDVEHKVPDAKRACPACAKDAKPAGTKESIEIEYVHGFFRRRRHLRETVACTCGQYIITADAPARVFDRTQYGPGFVAHLCVQKCADSIPIYRIEKQFARLGIPIARSTMTDLFHRAGALLEPLVERIAALVKESDLVLADETSHRMQTTSKKPYLWTFVASNLVLYRFAVDRSGDTPEAVLGDSKGILVVDAYSGYNAVTKPERRERAGCLAHARRKFFDASFLAPDAVVALDLIRDIYIVEREAKDAGVAGTDAHLAMRQARSAPLMDRLGVWITEQENRHLPKGPMGAAIRYARDNWTELTRFLRNSRIPPDNNRSEAALRVAALGRKNFLFVGHEDAGKNLANLYTLVSTCEANGVEPIAYLADVLMRVSTHPAARLDELLPHRWTPTAV